MKKTRKNKRKRGKKPANERVTATLSTDNTNEGEIDEMKIVKDSNLSSDDIQAACFSPQTAHEGKEENKDRCRSRDIILAEGYSPPESSKVGNKGKKNYNTSTCKVQTVEQKSGNMDSDLADKMLTETNEKMEDSARLFGVIHEKKYSEVMHTKQYKSFLDFLSEQQLDITKFSESEEPDLVEHFGRYLDIMKDQYNCGISAEDALTAPNSQEHNVTLENDGNEKITYTPADTERYSDGISILEKNDSKKENKWLNDKDRPSDDIQKATPFPQKLLERKKCEKDNKYTDTILTLGSSLRNIDDKKERIKRESSIHESEPSSHERELELKDEMLIGQIDEIEENLGDSKNIPEFKHSKNTVKNISPKQNNDFKHGLNESLKSHCARLIEKRKKSTGAESMLNNLKKKQHTFSTVKVVNDVEANEVIVSKELAGQAKDTIKDLEKVESQTTGNKSKKESDRSVGYIQAEDQSQPNVIEGKKDAKNGRKDQKKSNEEHQKSLFDRYMKKFIPKTKECLREEKGILQVVDSNNITKIITPKETIMDKKSSDEFLRDLEDFLRFQDSKLDNQVKKCQGVEQELKFVKEERDLLSSDIGTETAAEKTEIHEEAKIPMELEYTVTQEIGRSGKRDTFLTEKFTHLEKREVLVHFEFDTDGNKHIMIGDTYYFLRGGELNCIRCEIEKENIEISFIGSMIFISTKNSEFEISVRTSNFANQTDDTTQTDI